MSKTIDVEGGPRGWPPEGQPPGKGRSGAPRPPALITAAASVFGILIIFGIMMAASGRLGVANIRADQVGVVVNYLTGKEEVVSTPGFKIYIPFIEEVYTFDRSTQEFLMQGSKYQHNNHVPSLTVRASDGSNFRIDDLTIFYEIVPGMAGTLLHDSGAGQGFKEDWIKSNARSILRDEFGRYSAVEVANPTIYKTAPSEAEERMNEFLEPHGLRVVRINTPNPKFDIEYENAIEERKEADQEVERLIARDEQLTQEREQRLSAVRKEKEVERKDLEGDLIQALRQAEVRAIELKKSADAYAIERVANGEGLKAQWLEEARGLQAKYTKEAEGITSKALALEERGEVVVREAVIKKLLDIEFTLIPYSKDPAPNRLEHVGSSPLGRMLDVGDQGGN